MPYPTAVAVLPGGEIYAGLRLFVARFAPGAAGYSQEWQVPADCQRFEREETVEGPMHSYECKCLPVALRARPPERGPLSSPVV